VVELTLASSVIGKATDFLGTTTLVTLGALEAESFDAAAKAAVRFVMPG
jgi:hypothetical protein